MLIAGGSRGLTGAPTMAARASMRAGAGYVTACVPASMQPVVASSGVPELMTRALEEDPPQSGDIAAQAREAVLEAAQRGGSLALGPGLGRSDAAVDFARGLAREAQLPTVIDADGLNAHAGRLAELAARGAPTVLTPHAGELSRLTGYDSREIDAQRLHHVRAAAAESGAVVALKGDDTLVASPDGLVAVSPGRAPGLATAGTGDVLTGVVAALLSGGLDAFTAAAAGVLLHLLAGRLAARRVGAAEGVVAGDVIEALPAVRAPRGGRPATAVAVGDVADTLAGPSSPAGVGAPRRADASVNLAALERNCARMRRELRGGAALCAVVKADGYGHGALPSARAALAGGAGWLAVADPREAARAARGRARGGADPGDGAARRG